MISPFSFSVNLHEKLAVKKCLFPGVISRFLKYFMCPRIFLPEDLVFRIKKGPLSALTSHWCCDAHG